MRESGAAAVTVIPERYVHNGREYDLVDRQNQVWGLQFDGTYLGTLSGPDADDNPETHWLIESVAIPYEPSIPTFDTWQEALDDFLTKVELGTEEAAS